MKFGDSVKLSKKEANKGIAVCLLFIAVLLSAVYLWNRYVPTNVEPVKVKQTTETRSIFEGTMFR